MMKSKQRKSRRRAMWGALVASCLSLPNGASGDPGTDGTYVLWQKTVSTTKLPVVKDVTATTTAISLLQLNHKADRLSGSGTLCDLKLESTSSVVKTTFPDAFLKVVQSVSFDAKLEERAGRPYLVSTQKTQVLGANLKAPHLDPMPKEADDPRVYDQDGDGAPGVTVRVSGIVSGEVHLVQRTKTRFSGAATANGFAGGIHYELEQNVIGATSSMLKRGPNPVADPNGSAFSLIRVPKNTSCQQAKLAVDRTKAK